MTAKTFFVNLLRFFFLQSTISADEINILLMANVERDVRQWPVVVDLARQMVATDQLLPAETSLK